ncbi:polysaccharide deacetylase family protein [uncultured Clostridium sp.]|jgi:peptidoglycan/xylan/chitin deacetylase (PgdA/CDA1 family)|uniref:polysaccharide deacetylase family protein n=1 Tax=uncultured Clostridium sp. TaxID=59620 RepID=UPI0026085F5E|nr:polysaccharide deacetylase family protein [uncultured Clostridium sp.]
MRKSALKKLITTVIVIGVIGGLAYYGLSGSGSNTKIANAKIQTDSAIKAAKSIKTAEQITKEMEQVKVLKDMQTGHWASNKALGYINPIYKGYDPSLILQNENIIKSADSYAVPANDVAKMIDGTYKGTQKEVFLTFDDGPSPNNTPKILNILKENDVHATFFVVGKFLKSYPKLQNVVREELMNGNAVGDHTFNHEYTELYPNNEVSVSNYMKQDNETATLLKDLLGPDFNTRILRMPGGYMSRRYYNDPHLTALNKAFDKENITALDWNAETGDAETSGQLDVNKLVANVQNAIKGKNQVIILMHDAGAKVDTVTALPAVIKYFKAHGFAFKVIKNAPKSSFENIPVITNSNSNQE